MADPVSPFPEDGSGALHHASRGAWKLLTLIGAILAAVFTLGSVMYGIDRYLSRAVASEVVEARVVPIEKRLDEHLAGSRAMREVMDRYVSEERAARRVFARKLDALCRANPKADCPLGDD